MSLASPAKTAVLAIAGNPNSGKTTLFNRLTGLNQKVGNYPGITVERKEGFFQHASGSTQIIDLPGVYSLSPQSEEQRLACEALVGSRFELPRLDGVIIVVDSTSLEKSLYLVLQIIDLGTPAILVLNLADELALRGGRIDTQLLSSLLGIPVLSLSAAKGSGLLELEKKIATWPRFDPSKDMRAVLPLPVIEEAAKRRAEAKRLTKAVLLHSLKPHPWSDAIDRFVMHRVWGPIIFSLVVLTVFQSIFSWAQPLMDGVDSLFSRLATLVRQAPFPETLASFLADGVIAGVGSVVVFLPQILIVFTFISVLENTGYLARAALVMDKLMRKMGLQGKSFLPLISSYACAIPGIMATRTIESKRDRLATLFVAPFMTCSARLPVYALLIGAFVPDQPIFGKFFGWRALSLLGLYAVGFLAALFTSRILKSSLLKTDSLPFVLEIPPYRWPQWKSVGLMLWDRSKAFLKQAGTIILLVSMAMWFLLSFPKTNGTAEIENSYAGKLGKAIEPVIQPLGFDWKIGIGLISAQVAREVMVSTLATIERVDAGDDNPEPLQQALQKEMTPLKAFSLMIFFALAMQCTSTLAVVRRETGSWRIPAAMFLYMNALAYAASLAVYQLGRLF